MGVRVGGEGGGGGGGWKFLVTEKKCPQKHLPGVLIFFQKCSWGSFFFGGGGGYFGGVWGAPRLPPPLGGSRGVGKRHF